MSFFGYPTWSGTGSVGTDLQQLTIVNNTTGASVTLDGPLFRWDEKDRSHLIEGSPIDNGGVPWFRKIPKGWEGTIEAERFGSDFEQMYSVIEGFFYDQQPDTTFTMTVTKLNTGGPNSGGTSRFQYLGVIFHGYNGGTWEREQNVKPSVSWVASQKVPL